jgi:hypothetical protein
MTSGRPKDRPENLPCLRNEKAEIGVGWVFKRNGKMNKAESLRISSGVPKGACNSGFTLLLDRRESGLV